MTKYFGIILLALISFCGNPNAQINKNSTLFLELKNQDSIFFERGFNNCDINYMDNILEENLKFYHDKGGFQDKKLFMERSKQYLCGNPIQKPIRKVLSNSLQVFPLFNNGVLYGAIQSGEHQFYIREKNKNDILQGQAKFTTVWTFKNNIWKINEILSYDHGEPRPEANIFDNDSIIEKWLGQNNVKTLGLGIIEKGKLKQIKMYGEISKGNSAPYNTIFNVASLTKPITAIVALKLVSMGKWNLDEPLYHYFVDPDIASDPRNKKLATRLILSHQTGFPNWRNDTENKKLQFIFEPATKYGYSGEGFEYLRKALEKKFKKTLEKLAQELVFQPLLMDDTDYIWTKKTAESRFAIGYDENGNSYQTIKNTKANAADDLHTTIEDYGKFLINILEGATLSENTHQEMLKKQVKTKENKFFGLGFELYDLGKGEMAISHGGSDKGVQCITFLFPKTKNGILIFTNASAGYKIFNPILIHYLGEKGRKLIEIENK